MISSRKSACFYLIMRGPNLRMKITGRCSLKTVLACHGRNRQSAGTRKKNAASAAAIFRSANCQLLPTGRVNH